MLADELQRSRQERGVLRFVRPCGAARGVREDDDVEGFAGSSGAMNHADHVLELRFSEELKRGQGSHSDDELRLEDADLAIEVCAAVRDLGLVGDAIAARFGIAPRKTADDGAHVHARAKLRLRDAGALREPLEEPLTGRERERPLVDDLARPRRLPDEQNLRTGDRPDDGRADHVGACPAVREEVEVFGESRQQATGNRQRRAKHFPFCGAPPTRRRFSPSRPPSRRRSTHSGFPVTIDHVRETAIVLTLLLCPPAFGWTRASDERIASKAAQLAPSDMRILIEAFETEYKEGLARAQAEEGSDTHRYFVLSRDGRLRERIERETATTISMIRKGESMRGVITKLGSLAHLVADANNPFHIANDDPRLSVAQNDYEQYFERRLSKFPTVFYGLDPNFRPGAYFDRTFVRTASFYPLLSEEYFRFGERRTSSEFDDRSTAFGIASVCYSRAVSDLVNLYYYIWRQSGGDVREAAVMRGSNLLLNAN